MSSIASKLHLDATGPKKEVAQRIAKAILKPVSQRGAQVKQLRGTNMWRTRISGLSGMPISSNGHFSRGAAVKKVVAEFKKARVQMELLFGENSGAAHEMGIKTFDNEDKVRFGDICC